MGKKLILILSLVCVACFVLFACEEGSKTETPQFTDFFDQSIEMYYGDFMSLNNYLKVSDDNGKTYSVSAKVKDSSGNTVSILDNMFSITDLQGYTIELSVLDENDGSVLKTRVLAVKTKDNPAPFINIGTISNTVNQGDEISVPVTFVNKTNDFTSEVSAYVVGFDSETQQYDETRVTPIAVNYQSKSEEATVPTENAGRYKIVISAYNGSEKTENMFVREKSIYVDVMPMPKANEIENFDSPDSKNAAYGLNDLGNAEKSRLNNTSRWHDEFKGKYGVLELQPSKFYEATSSRAARDTYHIKSSFRDILFYAANEEWDYISVLVYVEGEAEESVKMSVSLYGDCLTSIKCNEWSEFRIAKAKAKFLSSSTTVTINGEKITGRTQQTVAAWLANVEPSPTISLRAPLLAIETSATEKSNRKIYLDGISYDKEIKFETSGKNETGEAITLSASVPTGKITDGFTYSVKKPSSDSYEKLSGNVFVPTETGVYELKAEREIDGIVRSEIISLTVSASNMIEGFDGEDSKAAAYGLNGRGNPQKNYTNDTAKWHADYNGRKGVLELQSVKYYAATSTRAARDCYYLKSSFRDYNYYAQNNDWDYISIWVYVDGANGEQVNISVSLYDDCKTTINCNEWSEFRISKDRALFLSSSKEVTINGEKVSGRTQQTVAAWLANSEPSPTISLSAPLIAIESSSEEKSNRKIYVDSISYEKTQNKGI